MKLQPAFEATVTFAPQAGADDDAAASRWPEWMRRLLRPYRAAPDEALDRSTGLYNRSGLFAAANEILQARGDEASMVLLDFADLREVYQIYGNAIARKVVERIVRRLRVLAGSRGLAGRTGPTQFAVVLPGVSQDKTICLLQRAMGKPARVEFDAGDSEIVVVPDFLVDTAEPGTTAIQMLYREMCQDLAHVQKAELRRLNWLTSERERHSRPMGLTSR